MSFQFSSLLCIVPFGLIYWDLFCHLLESPFSYLLNPACCDRLESESKERLEDNLEVTVSKTPDNMPEPSAVPPKSLYESIVYPDDCTVMVAFAESSEREEGEKSTRKLS